MRDVVIGLDLGHSAVKMTFDGKGGAIERAIFPSLASPAIQIRNEAEARMAAEETVTVRGRPFFVGQTAALQGKASLSTGLTADWINSDEHSALLGMAKRIVDKQAAVGRRMFVLGLPVQQFETHKEQLRKVAATHLGEDAEIRVMPQPMGGYQAHMLNRSGVVQAGRSLADESWGVVDVGYYSTDFILIMGGRWIEAASGGCGGVRMAAEHLQRLLDAQGIQRDLVDAEKALREGFIRNYGERVDLQKEVREAAEVVASKVGDMAAQLMAPYVHSLDGVLVTGGGANMVLPSLRDRWPHTRLIDDAHSQPTLSGSRFLVSEGYYRWGRNASLLRMVSNNAASSMRMMGQGA